MYMENLKEQIIKYNLYRMSFEQAIATLRVMKRYKKKDVRNLLFRSFVIAYAAPFSTNKRLKFVAGNHHCSDKFIPKSLKDLHNEIIKLRNELFAHVDLEARNPKLILCEINGERFFPMQFAAIFDYERLDTLYPNLLDLSNKVLSNIDSKMIKIENLFKEGLDEKELSTK
ncbi:hypothetical protein P0136_02910 [Lentisphaerota bacterium ZTH]|nr:hypothetical protein JYG24_05950 [Lentisphaerota bacterium]WET06952.1 hypothetical protein P0136_02910 [Lentisphaerota bacterium ZTH]